MKTKTIIVESSPTGRGESKDIALKVDQAIAAFKAESGADIKMFAVSGDVSPNSFNRVIVLVGYEGGKDKPAPAAETRAQQKATAKAEAEAQAKAKKAPKDKAPAAGETK